MRAEEPDVSDPLPSFRPFAFELLPQQHQNLDADPGWTDLFHPICILTDAESFVSAVRERMRAIDRRTATGYRAFEEVQRRVDEEYRQTTAYRRLYVVQGRCLRSQRDVEAWQRGQGLLSEALTQLRVARYLVRQLLINMDDWRRRHDRGAGVSSHAAPAVPADPAIGLGLAEDSDHEPAQLTVAPSSA